MTAPLRDRLHWQDGAVHDGPRRYLMMRPDVLMGALAALDDAARTAMLAAWTASTQRHGGQSLQAYAQQVGTHADALMTATAAAAADLGWGDWTLRQAPWGLSLQVAGSPFVDGWRAAAGGPASAPVCAPIRGMLTALAGLLPGGPLQVDEVHCAAMQADGACHCRFEARRPA